MDCAAPAHLDPLLRLLRRPATAANFDEVEWDRALRMARRARLHGVVADRVGAVDVRRLPRAVAGQLESARMEARFARQMLLLELAEVRRVLGAVEVLLLKGAAYEAQELDGARGRLPSDLDILVPHAQLESVERALLDAGWNATEVDGYDDRYYRRWSHQIPPLRAPGHVLEVDLHHTILPPLGRHRIPMAPLWQSSVELDAGLRVLARPDQVLHAIVHLFVDSDCTNRLRDLVDIGALYTQFERADPSFGDDLRARARELRLEAPLRHAAVFLREWLGVRMRDDEPLHTASSSPLRALMARRLAPPDPDSMPPRTDLAHAVLLGRSLWMRLPPHLALLHATRKALRGLRAE